MTAFDLIAWSFAYLFSLGCLFAFLYGFLAGALGLPYFVRRCIEAFDA